MALAPSSRSKPFPDEIPVLVVGAGPVGLAMASDLGWRGIDCLLVEQNDRTIGHPRANVVNARTMEFCRRWRVADAVRAASLPADFPHTILHVTSLTGWELSRLERDSHGGEAPSPFSPERQQQCNQIYFDPVMRNLAQSFEKVALRFRTKFIQFTQDRGGVMATLEDLESGTLRNVRCAYLIDCSGGASAIRETLKIGLEGTPVVGRSVNIFFRSTELRQVHDKGEAAMFMITGPKGVWANIVAINTVDFWRLTVQGVGEEVELSPKRLEAWLFETVGTEFDYRVRTVARWTRRTVVSERFREGRVFLAGDSAHQLSPSGGFGMNTGMGDVDNLGWKLDAVLKGWGGSRLLESYEIERRPIAVRNVAEAVAAFRVRNFDISPALLEDTQEGAAVRREIGERIDGETSLSFQADGVIFDYRYETSPIIAADGTPAPPYTLTKYKPMARPGSRALHGWLEDGRSILDLFGRGFALLQFGRSGDAPDRFASAARERGLPLAAHRIDDADLARLYQRQFVLVRPDGHVAWRGDTPPEDMNSLIDHVRGAG